MGRQAKLTRKRREMRRGSGAAIAALNETARDPQVQARLAEFHDGECARLKDRDRPAQVARLDAEGWERREQNLDGLGIWDHRQWRLRLVHSVAREDDGGAWAHVSVSRADGAMPGWYEVRNAGWVLYPGLFGIIVVAPEDRHVNLAEVAHVWYRLDGPPSCPDFSRGMGSI